MGRSQKEDARDLSNDNHLSKVIAVFLKDICLQVEETDKVIAEIETVSQQYLPLSQVRLILLIARFWLFVKILNIQFS